MTVKSPQPKKPAAKKTAAKKPAPEKPTRVLDLAHFSMQYSDTVKQKQHDAARIFGRGYDAMTGTEASEESTQRVMRAKAAEEGYRLFIRRSNWVAINRKIIVPGSYRKGHVMLVDNDEVYGPGHDLHVTWAGCTVEGLGEITFLSGHFATKGRPNGKDDILRINIGVNRTYAQGIETIVEKLAAGNKLAIYGGDQNNHDKAVDTFFGADLTSAWDELGKYEKTHAVGNIDVMASYDKDGRVKAKYIRALDDKELFMHSDHFPVEAGFEIELLSS